MRGVEKDRLRLSILHRFDFVYGAALHVMQLPQGMGIERDADRADADVDRAAITSRDLAEIFLKG
jgi:hypothetical protein